MGFFSDSPEGITKYKWDNEIKSRLWGRLDLNTEKWTMIQAMFLPYFMGRREIDRGITNDELDYQIGWIKANYEHFPGRPFYEKDILVLEETLNEFKRK